MIMVQGNTDNDGDGVRYEFHRHHDHCAALSLSWIVKEIHSDGYSDNRNGRDSYR